MKNSKTQFGNPAARPGFLAVSLCIIFAVTASAATDTWTGGVSPNGNWSAGGNWLSGTPPSPADSLVFTNQSGVAASPNDDFAAGTLFDGITFGSSSIGSTLALAGNSILLSGATNGIAIGVNNTTSLAETVNNNLALDWGNYPLSSLAGSLNLNGTLTANLAGVAVFGPVNVKSTSFTTDGTGLIAGLGGAGLFGNTGTGGGYISLATINGGAVSAYVYTGASVVAAAGAIGATTQANATNLELTATVAGSYTLTGGTSTTYGASDTFINTVLATESSSVKLIVGSADNGTLVMGTTNNGTGMYTGGFYFPSAQSSQELTVGGGTTSFLTAGPMTGNPVPGEIIFAINGTSTSNEGELNAMTRDNLSGGKVSVVKTGTGSMYFAASNSYSGGTYVNQGYVQINNNGGLGSGPVYVASGATLYLNNGATGSWSNNIAISPGVGNLFLGAIKITGGTNNGNITLLGAPVTGAPGDRIAPSGNNNVYTFLGQLTGPGTLELYADAATINCLLANTGPANNWTGGLIVDGANNDSMYAKLGSNNQLGGNNVTLIQAGTGAARLDLNGFNDTIGGLNSSGASTLNELADYAGLPSILTLGANNASGSFSGVIGGDSAPNSLSIIKIGSGTQALSGANTYTGNTLVEGGTLALTGTASITGSPQITVSNATFDVSAASSYAGPGVIGMTNGTFNVGSVVVSGVTSLSISNSTLAFPLNQSATSLTVGTLVTGGNTNTINLTSVPGFGSYPQQLHLIQYGSFANVNANNVLTSLGVILPSVGGLAGYLTNDTANNSIDLVLTTGPVIPVEPITWNGRTNGVTTGAWDILTTSNWVLTANGVTPYFYQDTSPVTFDDTLHGTTTVNLTKTVLPASITMNNVNSNYVFVGTGKISGTAGLTNNGVGLLTLTETGGDNFSGGITVNSGTVVIDNNSGGITGGLTVNGGAVQVGNNDAKGVLPQDGLTDNGALVFNRSDTALNFTTAIAGTGSLTNIGSGTVTLSAGPNDIAATINNGIIEINGGGGAGGCLASNIVVNAAGELDLNVNDSLGYNAILPPVTISGIVKKLNSQSETMGRPIIMAGGSLVTTLAGVEQYETYGNFIQTVAGTTNFIDGPGKIGLRTASCYITNELASTLIISCVIETNANAGGNTAPLNKYGSGTLILTANNTFTGGANFYGGVVQLGTASDTAALSTPLGYGGPVTMATNAVLNFASSKGVTVTNAISDDGLSNTVVVASSGTNILGGADTYTGNTIVNAGAKLVLKGLGSINSSGLITVSNAILDVSASASTVNNTCGFLSLTNSTLNLGANFVTALNSLAITNATLTFSVNPATPNINLTGALGVLTTGGTTNVINLTAVPGFLNYPTNIHLITYSGFVNVGANNTLTNLGLILPALGSPVGYLTNNVGNSSIDLVVLSDTLAPVYPITWNGRAGGVNTGLWDVQLTRDWVFTSDGVTPYYFLNTAPVTFDDTAAGTTAINLTTNVSPASITLNNTTKNYTISGSGSISGTTGVTMGGGGMATFAETGADNFGGGVTVNSGTLTLADANVNVNISGGLTVNGGSLIDQHGGIINGDLDVNSGLAVLDQAGSITGNLNDSGTVQVGNNDANGNLPYGTLNDGGTLIFDRSDSALNVGAVIAGGGTLENNGTGTVTLSAVETLSGSVVVNAGTLAVNESVNGNPDGISAASSLTINTNGTFMFESDNAGFGTAAAGSVPVTINAGGTLTGLGSADGGDGTSSHIPNVLTLNGGTLAMQGPPAALPSHGSWDLYSGVTVNSGPNYRTTSTISALGVIPTQSGGTAFDVAASPGGTPSGIDLLVSGSLIDGSAGGVFVGSGIILNPNGETGVMALDNNNTFLGGVTIDGGTLQLGTASDTNALSEPLGAGVVTINNAGSTLDFAGAIGVTVTNVISDDNNSDALVLVSSGTNVLTAANAYTAPTVISNGTLVVNGSLASASVVTVGSRGILSGDGTVGGNVTASGFIAPGTTATIGTLTCSGNVTITGGSVMKLSFPNLTNDVLSVDGTLTYGGTLKVTDLTGAPSGNVTFHLFSAGGYSGNFTATNLPALGGGQAWTWNPASGTLSLVSTVNTNPTNITASVSGNLLTLSWPADHTGWRLQVQTNSLSTGLSDNWFTVPGSTTVDTESFTVNPGNGTVFYRMVYP